VVPEKIAPICSKVRKSGSLHTLLKIVETAGILVMFAIFWNKKHTKPQSGRGVLKMILELLLMAEIRQSPVEVGS